MDTLIHCPHCHEDMNPADWSANHGCCCHCGWRTGDPATARRRPAPFGRLRVRLAFDGLARLCLQPATTLEDRLYA
jgi:hypothetical protein